MERLQYFDQLWVASEWQRAASIAQGVPEEFIKVVPEGVDPDIYRPNSDLPRPDGFHFLHVFSMIHFLGHDQIPFVYVFILWLKISLQGLSFPKFVLALYKKTVR
jgi:hypothetical protein